MRRPSLKYLAALSVTLPAVLSASAALAQQAPQKAFAMEGNRGGFAVVTPPQGNVFTTAPTRAANAAETYAPRRPRTVTSGAYYEGVTSTEAPPPAGAPPQGVTSPNGPTADVDDPHARPAPAREAATSPGEPPQTDEGAAGERSAERPPVEPSEGDRPEG